MDELINIGLIMNNLFSVKCFYILLAVVLFSKSSFAGLITIDQNVQDTWWWNGIAEPKTTQLRTNDISISDQRIGVQFNDLSALDNVNIVSAELQMYRYSGYWGSDADMAIDAYSITSTWDESSIIPSYDSYAIASTTYADAEAKGWQTWDITELTQGWLMEEVINNGVMLAGLGDNYFQRFYSSEQLGFGPRLVVKTVDVSEPSVLFSFLFMVMLVRKIMIARPRGSLKFS